MRPLPARKSRQWLWLAGIIVIVTLLALPVLTYPLGRDQGEFATIGRGLLDGRVPYRDLWNPKPPAVFYVYALAMQLFGRTAALRLIDLLIVPVICWALWWLGKRFGNNRVGFWTALIFPVFYFSETFWTLTQNDGIVLLPMVLAMVSTVAASSPQIVLPAQTLTPDPQPLPVNQRRPSRNQQLLALLGGLLAGYVFWFKYPFLLFAALLPLVYWLLKPPTQKRFRLTTADLHQLANFSGGLLFVLGGGIIYLMSIGAWDELVVSAQVTSQYTALTFNLSDFGALLATALGYRWAQWGLLALLALLGLIAGRRGHGWLVILLWLLTGLVIMLAQAKAYDYHWLPMLPPLALLAGMGVEKALAKVNGLFSRGESPLRPYHILTTLLAVVMVVLLFAILAFNTWGQAWPYLSGTEDQNTYYSRFVAGEFRAEESQQVADALRQRVVPGDSLFIWGFRPEIYYLSGLNPATRFIFQFPLVGSWYPPQWREEAVETLWAAMPPYALVLQIDYMPWVTGSKDDSNTLLQSYTEMNNWLIANYERETQIGNFFLWRRKS